MFFQKITAIVKERIDIHTGRISKKLDGAETRNVVKTTYYVCFIPVACVRVPFR